MDRELRLLPPVCEGNTELAARISGIIFSKRLTHAAAARVLHVDQPKVSALLRGRLPGFSTERLLKFLRMLGSDSRHSSSEFDSGRGEWGTFTCCLPELVGLRLGLFQQLPQPLDEGREVLSRCLPKRLVRDAEVLVDDDVPHSAHFRPGHVGIGRDYVIGNVPRGLADDAVAEENCVDGFLVGEERREVHTAVYRCTRSTAARMSSMRRRHSLGGTDRLGEDSRAQLALDRVFHDQIDVSPDDGLEPALDPEELKEAHGLVELDQKVHIAVCTRVPARDGTEEIERTDPESLELCPMFRESSLDFLSPHDWNHRAAGSGRPATRGRRSSGGLR